jgi:hypothetical protein
MNLSLFGGTLQRSPETYKFKHPNGAQFVFMHQLGLVYGCALLVQLAWQIDLKMQSCNGKEAKIIYGYIHN